MPVVYNVAFAKYNRPASLLRVCYEISAAFGAQIQVGPEARKLACLFDPKSQNHRTNQTISRILILRIGQKRPEDEMQNVILISQQTLSSARTKTVFLLISAPACLPFRDRQAQTGQIKFQSSKQQCIPAVKILIFLDLDR